MLLSGSSRDGGIGIPFSLWMCVKSGCQGLVVKPLRSVRAKRRGEEEAMQGEGGEWVECRESGKEMGEAALRGLWLELGWRVDKERPQKKQLSFGKSHGVGWSTCGRFPRKKRQPRCRLFAAGLRRGWAGGSWSLSGEHERPAGARGPGRAEAGSLWPGSS